MKTKAKKLNFKKLKRRSTPAAESRVVLYGSPKDPDVMNSINRIGITKRKVEVTPRPSFDTGLGKCGQHLCSCKTACKKQFSAFEGDQGATMGMSY